LANRLNEAIDSGETQRYEERYLAHLETLPPEPCELCGGTGRRANVSCKGCNGTGNLKTRYSFSVGNVREFAVFLKNCGGFRIC
jgi:DnaJ-class molecular chaperone